MRRVEQNRRSPFHYNEHTAVQSPQYHPASPTLPAQPSASKASWTNSTPHSEHFTPCTHTPSLPSSQTASRTTTTLAQHTVASARYGTLPVIGAPRETWKNKTGSYDEEHLPGTGSSIHGYHPDASGIYTATGWVPWWITDVDGKLRWPQPISHAWVDEKERADVWTPINGYEWPVPVPKESDLNLIRIEMLNLGLEYAWLDVLCLRQAGGPGEDVRAEEWKLDVPMIGAVYRATRVVLYLNGLGRPLTLKEGDLDSDRSWFRRAWTLQEVGWERVIAGDTLDGPLQAKP